MLRKICNEKGHTPEIGKKRMRYTTYTGKGADRAYMAIWLITPRRPHKAFSTIVLIRPIRPLRL